MTHSTECSVYRRVVCVHCGHHDHSHDRRTSECKWSGCQCKGFEPIEANAKYITRCLKCGHEEHHPKEGKRS